MGRGGRARPWLAALGAGVVVCGLAALALVLSCRPQQPHDAPPSAAPAATPPRDRGEEARTLVADGAARRLRGDLDGAERALTRAGELGAPPQEALPQLGLVYLARYEAAAGFLTPFLQQHGPLSLGPSADIEEDAAPWRLRALAAFGTVPAQRLSPEACAVMEGATAFAEGRFADAEKAFGAAPDHVEAGAWRARVLQMMGRYSDALAALDRYIERHGDDPHGWLARSVCRLALAVEAADSRRADDATAEYVEARRDCAKAIALDARCVHALYVLGVIHHRQGFGATEESPHYAPALEAYTKALALDPDFALTYLTRSLLVMDNQQLEKSLADLTEFIKRKPKASIGYNRRASIYIRRNDLEHAVEDYTTAVTVHPRYFYGYTNRAQTYMMMEKWADAAGDYTRAIELQPDYAHGFANRGVCYHRMSRPFDALKDYERAVNLQPRYEPQLRRLMEEARRQSREN